MSFPASELLINNCRARLYIVVIEPPGVDGVRGVSAFPVRITRCRGVTGSLLESASRCLGVWGVGIWTQTFSSVIRQLIATKPTLACLREPC
jgi:hypothetical protein